MNMIPKFYFCLFILIIPLFAQATEGLVLWNRLGSTDEVLNSDFGPGFTIQTDGGEVLFVDGRFGSALATTGGTASTGPAGGYLLMNPDDFFPADKKLKGHPYLENIKPVKN